MRPPIRRSRFLAGAGTLATIHAVRGRAPAAQFTYKFGHPVPTDFPPHVAIAEFAEAVKRETGGRLEIQVFPNSVLGSQTSMLSQLRLGSIQFYFSGNSTYSSVVPVSATDSVGFAFSSTKQAFAALDGALGAYIRREFSAKGIYAFEKAVDVGFREMTSSNRPIRVADDFLGFKMRTPPAAQAVDLFRTLGASPVALDVNELYTALQTHVVDGQETPLTAIESFRLYEVQKYCSLTNHIWNGGWWLANGDAWAALPADIQAVVNRNAAKYALLERRDMFLQNNSVADKLKRQGMVFNDADVATMRAKIGPYYARQKTELGSTAWSLLEASVGKLG